MKKVFIDGKSGTTGLRIFDRLSARSDIELIQLPEESRKSEDARRYAINNSDVVFLCLPDDAAKQSVSLIENEDVVVIDTSTAHRTQPGWTYGFPELFADGEKRIAESKRISVPGCHASGFNALIAPLVNNGIIGSDVLLTCFSITGYSGGGKSMIAQYREDGGDTMLSAPRQYGLSQQHKHLREMRAICSLENEPVFCPVVASYYSGMEVTVPLFSSTLLQGKTVDSIKNVYKNCYNGKIVKYAEGKSEDGFLSASVLSGKDIMEISVFGNEKRILLTARFDNLGKGASGAAIECLNIVLGTDAYKDLSL